MIGNYLADTNVFVRLLRNDATVAAKLPTLSGVCLCTHVLGELYDGAHRSNRVQHNIAEVSDLLRSTPLIPTDRETAEEYGRLKASLRAAGTPLPENDMWIAATALRHNLTLITYDAHFDLIANLTKERW